MTKDPHLKKDSLQINQGEIVSEGNRVGSAGNSGNMTQPHLHIHAVPITLDGRFPTRNSLIG